jgi:hypothetical protein
MKWELRSGSLNWAATRALLNSRCHTGGGNAMKVSCGKAGLLQVQQRCADGAGLGGRLSRRARLGRTFFLSSTLLGCWVLGAECWLVCLGAGFSPCPSSHWMPCPCTDRRPQAASEHARRMKSRVKRQVVVDCLSSPLCPSLPPPPLTTPRGSCLRGPALAAPLARHRNPKVSHELTQ